jgi:dTDP-4-amino-4,6-dideoxygalactose transaminase
MTIPVYRARLPRAAELLPYLAVADAARWYTNRGELACTLERRLATVLGRDAISVIAAATGTAALQGAILAVAGRAGAQRPLALMPAYTFVATAMAAEACGFVPYLVDVDRTTWALDPERLLEHPKLSTAGVVIPVAPYGRPPEQSRWAEFAARTGVPVAIDAAAAFEAIAADPPRFTGTIPVALSFQVTKAFSCAEGGAVLWSDFEGLMNVVRGLNFGFLGTRESTAHGTNGKLSEYHAAVGLASLDAWDEKCAANRRAAGTYRSTAAAYGIDARLTVAPSVASNYALIDAGSAERAAAVAGALRAEGAESRLWYGCGLHREAYFRSAPRDALPCTDAIAPAVVGVPIFEDITAAEIERVVAAAARVLHEPEKGADRWTTDSSSMR